MQLLIRSRPKIEASELKKFEGAQDVIIDYPDYFAGLKKDLSDSLRLANTLKHADVVVNVASTITIEAAIFDTPIVNIAFDGFAKQPYWNSTRRYYNYSHYKKITATRGVRVAKNPRQLLEYLNAYLEKLRLDAGGRRKIVKQQCWKTDGAASKRLAEQVIRLAAESENKTKKYK